MWSGEKFIKNFGAVAFFYIRFGLFSNSWIGNVSLKLDYIFRKTNSLPTTTMPTTLSLPGQEAHSISQHWKLFTSKP